VRQAAPLVDALCAAGWEQRSVRGEDVPQIANDLARRGRPVVGITGDDLLEEWLAGGNALDPRLTREARPWSDEAAIYGAPALCLIGAESAALPRERRIAICNKYRNLAERYVRSLETDGATYERVYISGALENVQLLGLADFIIDVVVTGATVRSAGLAVRDVISRSAVAVLETRA
jgi:ATP phosphoribosyltransferase